MMKTFKSKHYKSKKTKAMKSYITTFILSFCTLIALAQAPQLISYQAEIRNGSNNLIINQQVGMRFSILLGSTTGTAVYVETHTPTTNVNGLVSLQIGGGTVQSGNFANINWGNGAYYLKTETDPTGGVSYSITGTQQLLSVPYALYSNRSGNGLNNGTAANQMLYWNGTSWVTVAPPTAQCQVLTYCGNQIIWTNGGVCPGCVSTINCAGASNSGTLTAGVAASAVSSSIPYTSGVGGAHSGQVVSSTGVTGLTATLVPGNFANGSGSLVYTITGTPIGCGTATFLINVGGLTCVLNRTVNCNGTISTLNCAGASHSGTLLQGTVASNVSSVVSYTGGNGGYHNGQTVASTGVTGLTATLLPGQFAVGNSTLVYTITGTPVGCGTASFALNIGGRTCTLARVVSCNGSIGSLNCVDALHSGVLTQGTVASGVSSSVSYTLGNGGSHLGQVVMSTGVTGLTATLAAGTFVNGNGSLNYTITGTPVGCGTASFVLNIGGRTCTLTRTVNCTGSIATLNCNTATNNGTLTQNVAASGVSSLISYSGGNAGSYSAQSVASTGVLGLTATLSAGNFVSGNGTITYTISGTPTGCGTASFTILIGGQTCTLTRTVNCPPGVVTTLNCAGATTTGMIAQSLPVQGVSVSIPYTGGNGGLYGAQTINSTGITGLTATLSAGNFANGAGTLIYSITGTPSGAGSASFAISIGGQTCSLVLTVLAGLPHTCGTANIHNPTKTYGTMTDQQGNTYKTIVIGTQEWMAENLKTTVYRNGNTIPTIASGATWDYTITGAYALPNGNSGLDCPYGKLYNHFAVTDSRNLCPTGWHVPTIGEWNTLINFLGGGAVAGRRMKTTSLWTFYTNEFSGTNESGFSGLPAGARTDNEGAYMAIDQLGLYWSWDNSDQLPDIAGKGVRMSYDAAAINTTEAIKQQGYSVRCVKD